jgi:predicted membrane channel-forming protein YqfA (hemolysin III family)
MINRSPSFSFAIIFTYINASLWLIFGLILVFDAHPALPDMPLYKVGMALLSIMISGILFVLGLFIFRQSRIAIYLAIGLLSITALLSIFDDFGLADLAFLIINLIPLVLLIKDRGWYLKPNPHNIDGNSE